MTDDLPDDINPGIRKTVEWLREQGFDTCDSGDGATHMAECDRDHPYVVMTVEPSRLIEETHRLRAALETLGLEVVNMGPDPNDGVSIQASYDPVTAIGCIDLMGLRDRDWL